MADIWRETKTKVNEPREKSWTVTYVIHGFANEEQADDYKRKFDEILRKGTGQETIDQFVEKKEEED